MMYPLDAPFWSVSGEDLLRQLQSGVEGLSSEEAARRWNDAQERAQSRHSLSTLWLLLGQFKSPITLILILAACLSFFLHDSIDAVIIVSIIVISALLGFWQEYGAATALRKLLSLVTIRASEQAGSWCPACPPSGGELRSPCCCSCWPVDSAGRGYKFPIRAGRFLRTWLT